VLRPKWTELYAARRKQRNAASHLPELPDSFFGWIPVLYRITEDEVLQSAGLDAYVVRFHLLRDCDPQGKFLWANVESMIVPVLLQVRDPVPIIRLLLRRRRPPSRALQIYWQIRGPRVGS